MLSETFREYCKGHKVAHNPSNAVLVMQKTDIEGRVFSQQAFIWLLHYIKDQKGGTWSISSSPGKRSV